MPDMRPFIVIIHEEHAELVWAVDAAQAGALGAKDADVEGYDVGVEAVEPVDDWGPARAIPHVDRRVAAQRQYGLRVPDDRECEVCGLAEMGGRWRVCDLCCACSECGHEDGCERAADAPR